MNPLRKKSSPVYRSLIALALMGVAIVSWTVRVRQTQTAPASSASQSSPIATASLPATDQTPDPQYAPPSGTAGAEKRETVAWLNARLDSGVDAPTGKGFILGSGGRLTEAPTLRVAWLEELGRRDPAAAARQAEKILAAPTTPEEWGAALRWLAQGNPQARELLEEKVRALLQNPDWRKAPAVAWLEAFDAAVYLGGTALLPELTSLARDQDNRPASHAAFLALDRLVQKDTASVLAALRADDNLLVTREAMRGNLFARADVGDAGQKRVLEEYLLAPGRSPAELEAFADVFPNANFHISFNLLTVSQAPDPATQRARDNAALSVVRAWRKDVRFTGLDSHLARIEARLEEFVAAR